MHSSLLSPPLAPPAAGAIQKAVHTHSATSPTTQLRTSREARPREAEAAGAAPLARLAAGLAEEPAAAARRRVTILNTELVKWK